jgi:hypothetical protein
LVKSGNTSGAAGVLFPIEALWLGSLSAAATGQLAVLFLGFRGLQIAAFSIARIVWQRRAYGYITLGLIFSETTLWFPEPTVAVAA